MKGSTTLTIGEKTFMTGQTVPTPSGEGLIIGLDPFAEKEIGVWLAGGVLEWFSFLEIPPPGQPEQIDVGEP